MGNNGGLVAAPVSWNDRFGLQALFLAYMVANLSVVRGGRRIVIVSPGILRRGARVRVFPGRGIVVASMAPVWDSGCRVGLCTACESFARSVR